MQNVTSSVSASKSCPGERVRGGDEALSLQDESQYRSESYVPQVLSSRVSAYLQIA